MSCISKDDTRKQAIERLISVFNDNPSACTMCCFSVVHYQHMIMQTIMGRRDPQLFDDLITMTMALTPSEAVVNGTLDTLRKTINNSSVIVEINKTLKDTH